MALSSFLVGAVQMTSAGDRARNLETALRLVGQAADRGAKLIGLPENFSFMGRDEDRISGAETLEGPTLVGVARAGAAARGAPPRRVLPGAGAGGRQDRQHERPHRGRWLDRRRLPQDSPLRRRHPRRGPLRGVGDGGPGREPVVATTALGRIGLSVCYDLRFPELYRKLSEGGADLLTVPAAFTLFTGKDHWEVLLRARAIENQAYVLAPAQCGRHSANRVTFGNTMIVDPVGSGAGALPGRGRGRLRGRVLARAPRAGAARGAGAAAPAQLVPAPRTRTGCPRRR